MPVCVHCGSTVQSLYTIYGQSHVHVLACSSPSCSRRFADPYIEHELTTVLLDLILVKASAYRHLLFNRGARDGVKGDGKADSGSALPMWWAVIKRCFALVLVDAYLKWFYLCQAAPQPARLERSSFGPDQQTLALLSSYLGMLRSCAIETLVLHVVVVSLSSAWLSLLRWRTSSRRSPAPSRSASSLQLFRSPLVSSALLLSQLTPLLLLSLLLLWQSRSKLVEPDTLTTIVTPSLNTSTPLASLFAPPSKLVEIPTWWGGLTAAMERRLSGSDWNASVDWAIRCIIGGLSAGVGLAVLLPRSSLLTTTILLLGWYAQSLARAHLGLPSGSGAGISGTHEGLLAGKRYCKAMA